MINEKYITVEELARRLGVTVRAVQWHLKRGNPIKGVKSYSKLSSKKTSPYLIIPEKE